MESCLDTAGYDDMDDQNQKVYMSYCGFACQTCEHEKVPMADVNGGGTANALGHINSQGTEDGTPPGWWMTTMSAVLSKVKAKSAIRLQHWLKKYVSTEGSKFLNRRGIEHIL